jgi:hypothetical protein
MNTMIRGVLIVSVAVLIAWFGNMAVSSPSFAVFERGFASEMHHGEGGHRHREHHEGGEGGGAAGELLKSAVLVSVVGAVTVSGSLLSRRRKRFKHRAES